MTEKEQRLEDDKLRADIAQANATIAHLNAMTAKLAKETQWYEALILTGMLAAGAAVGKLLL